MKYFIDFEATQFSNEIIAIGCVRENGDEFYSLINPHKKITPFITELTGITNEMLAEAPSAEEVFSNFFDWCAETNDLPLFYCYGHSDIYFVKKNFNRSRSFKAKSILGYLFSDLCDYEINVRKHFGLIQAASLINVVNYYNKEELTQTHNALADAKMLKFVYEKVQESDVEEDQEGFLEYQAQIVPPKVEADREVVEETDEVIVEQYIKNKKIRTFNSLDDAIEWVFNKLPDNDEKEKVIKSNLGNKIKRSSKTGRKYLNFKWKVKRK